MTTREKRSTVIVKSEATKQTGVVCLASSPIIQEPTSMKRNDNVLLAER